MSQPKGTNPSTGETQAVRQIGVAQYWHGHIKALQYLHKKYERFVYTRDDPRPSNRIAFATDVARKMFHTACSDMFDAMVANPLVYRIDSIIDSAGQQHTISPIARQQRVYSTEEACRDYFRFERFCGGYTAGGTVLKLVIDLYGDDPSDRPKIRNIKDEFDADGIIANNMARRLLLRLAFSHPTMHSEVGSRIQRMFSIVDLLTNEEVVLR